VDVEALETIDGEIVLAHAGVRARYFAHNAEQQAQKPALRSSKVLTPRLANTSTHLASALSFTKMHTDSHLQCACVRVCVFKSALCV
jgi:hypothetical protein